MIPFAKQKMQITNLRLLCSTVVTFHCYCIVSGKFTMIIINDEKGKFKTFLHENLKT